MIDVTTIHQPVLLRDCVDLVAPALANPGSIAVDCTLGLAGHSTAFLKASPHARLIGIDRDTEALALATQRMQMEGLAIASYLCMPHSTISRKCLMIEESIK